LWKGVIEALNSCQEELAEEQAPQDQESNVGLVIDGEVRAC